MGFTPFNISQLNLVATTGITGFALVNGTPTILSWTAPNDGNLHRIMFFASMDVSSNETGGAVDIVFTDPAGTIVVWSFFLANQNAGYNYGQATIIFPIVKPGTTVYITQGTALTAGAATLWAEIWAS
jgi:hypothetical protein